MYRGREARANAETSLTKRLENLDDHVLDDKIRKLKKFLGWRSFSLLADGGTKLKIYLQKLLTEKERRRQSKMGQGHVEGPQPEIREFQECSDDEGDEKKEEDIPLARRVRQRTGEVGPLMSSFKEGGPFSEGEEETKDPNAKLVKTLLGQLQEMTAERDCLRSELEAIRAERDTIVAERDVPRTERDTAMADRDTLQVERDGLQAQLYAERGRGDGAQGDGTVAILERQLNRAQQDAQYYVGRSFYYHALLTTHAPGIPVTPYSHIASHPSHSRDMMSPPRNI